MLRSRLLMAVAGAGLASAALIYRAPIGEVHAAGAAATYNVLIKDVSSRSAAIAAVGRAGGTIVRENAAIGALRVTAPASGFAARVSASGAIVGAAVDRPIGRMPRRSIARPERAAMARVKAAAPPDSDVPTPPSTAGLDPLDAGQWGLRMVRSDLARTVQAGNRRVLVGILDTGVDRTHPDLIGNLNTDMSVNFVSDIELDPLGQPIDGPCETLGCHDPAGTDDSGHGTHLAGIVAAGANGFGISGVAPNVTLVDIRIAQDSGYFFLWPMVEGLMYAANIGVDVALIGGSIDPWLFNCSDNPGDTPEAQAAQRLTITAISRALEYARRRAVTVIGALGNTHQDLGSPQADSLSPNYPNGTSYTRTIDNSSCFHLPVEGPHVIGVSALGPSEQKADYSNYGTEQTSVSGPGGWFRDFFGTPQFRVNTNLVLSTYPQAVGRVDGNIDDSGNVTPQGVALGVTRACGPAGCAYYQYLQGTVMAAAHVAGVAALIVSQHGQRSGEGWTMDPSDVERVLLGTARTHACPVPALMDYSNVGRDPSFNALCSGTPQFNGFYGSGIADADRAVREGRQFVGQP